jgi:hypothetical protein
MSDAAHGVQKRRPRRSVACRSRRYY